MRMRLMRAISILWVFSILFTNVVQGELVGWWKFDETSGAVVGDSSGNDNHGTLRGNPQWTAGQVEGALRLDGTDDYVELPIGSLVESLTDTTLAVWVNYSGQGGAWQRIFDFGTGTANYIYLCPQDGSGVMHTAITANTGIWTDVTANSGALPTGWHHVAIVMDAKAMNLKILLDGEVVANSTTLYLLSSLGNTTQNWLGRSQYADPYFNGMLDDFRIYDEVLSAEQIRRIMRGETAPSLHPAPPDQATDVPRDVTLAWTPGRFADTHNVYFSPVSEDVDAADVTNPLDALVSQGQDANSFDPGRLEFGQTYYWRVDEVNAPPDGTIFRGRVWSFTVEPFSYPVTGITATASSANKADMGPEKTIDASGLNTDNQHSTISSDMWLSAKGGAQPTWIQYEFDKVIKLDKMLVWNSNQALEVILGIGAKDVTVEYSTDGTAWTTLGDFEFAQAPGAASYAADTVVDFAGQAAKFVKLTIHSNWGGILAQYGLSEVRFYSFPVMARQPNPADDATEVNPQVALTWRPGREAASHQVLVSDDPQAVIDGTAPAATVSAPEHEATLNLSTTYYWKVVEVNNAEALSTWAGDVWSFTTADFVAVEDFESYTDDEGERIYESWIDGYEDPANGSLVGYAQAPFAEQTIVHSGEQSMPLEYANTGAAYSEAKRTFATAQDWTQHGITTLVLYFQGKAANSPASLYVKINDKKIVYNNGAPATTLPLWKQWNIDLASSGATLKSVKSFAIGVEGSGSGLLFIDDIRLYEVPPELVTPTNPGTTGLVALYALDGNVQDSSGRNNHGTVGGTAGYEDGPSGQAIIFNGTNTYVTLPIGATIAALSDATIATNVYFANTGGSWQRIFDFGTDTTVYMFLSPRQGTSGSMRFAIRTAAVGEQIVDAPATLPSGWHHVAVVIDSSTMTITLYLDGEAVGSNATTLLPKDMGNTTQNWLGRSQYAADAYFTGSLDEFRIYNRVLSAAEVRYLAGDR